MNGEFAYVDVLDSVGGGGEGSFYPFWAGFNKGELNTPREK